MFDEEGIVINIIIKLFNDQKKDNNIRKNYFLLNTFYRLWWIPQWERFVHVLLRQHEADYVHGWGDAHTGDQVQRYPDTVRRSDFDLLLQGTYSQYKTVS